MVTHSSLSDAAEGAADLFVVGKDLENFVKQLKEANTTFLYSHQGGIIGKESMYDRYKHKYPLI